MARRSTVHPSLAGSSDNSGAEPDNNGGGFDEPLDPVAFGTSGSDSGSAGADDYSRNADGSVKRNADGSPAKKRGRKAGSGSAKPKARVHDLKSSVDSLTSMLGVLHMGIATATNAPEMMLTESEARELATATVPVLDLFDWMPDPRYAAIGGFLIVAGKLYVPRVAAISSRVKEAKTRRPAPVKPAPMQPAPFSQSTGFADFGDPTRAN